MLEFLSPEHECVLARPDATHIATCLLTRLPEFELRVSSLSSSR